MKKKKMFVNHPNLRLLLKRKTVDHPRLDDIESQPKQDFAQGTGFLAEMRQLDQAADEALKSHAATTS